MIVYKVTNLKNKKSYIGQTIYNIEVRKNTHLSEANRSNLPFHNALLKDFKHFKWEILIKCNSKEEMDEMEFHYIKQYNTIFPNGYNLTLGGEGNFGWKPTKEQKENNSTAQKKWWSKQSNDYKKNHGKKMSNINKGRIGWSKGLTKENDKRIMKLSISNSGKSLSKEQKIKIGNSIRGQKRTNKTKELIRQKQLGRNNSFYGKKHNQETIKNKMTFNGKDNPFYGKTHSKETLIKKSKNTYEITYPNGSKEFIKVFSIWCKENNINQYKLWYESKQGRSYNNYFVKKL